jgi:hypothetical protein
MEPIASGHSIVMVGGWNVRIFSPLWVTQHLTDEQEVGLEVAVNNPALPMRLVFEGLQMEVSGTRIALKPAAADGETLRRLQRVARRILELLPHTPVSAVGVNLKYLEQRPEPELARLFQLGDNDALSGMGIQIASTTLRRSLLIDGRALHFSVTFQEDDAVAFDFNYHHPSQNAVQAREHLNADVGEYCTLSARILTDAYHLEPAEAG